MRLPRGIQCTVSPQLHFRGRPRITGATEVRALEFIKVEMDPISKTQRDCLLVRMRKVYVLFQPMKSSLNNGRSVAMSRPSLSLEGGIYGAESLLHNGCGIF